MPSFLPDRLSWRAEVCHLTQPIASIAEMIARQPKSGQYQLSWPQEMAARYGPKGYNDFECLGAWQIVTVNALVGIVDTVRSRLLDFVLKIEGENPDAGEAPLDSAPVPIERIQPLVQNIFYGSVGNIAQHSERFTQKATLSGSAEDLEKLVCDLLGHISELTLEDRQKERAIAQIEVLQTELKGENQTELLSRKLAARYATSLRGQLPARLQLQPNRPSGNRYMRC